MLYSDTHILYSVFLSYVPVLPNLPRSTMVVASGADPTGEPPGDPSEYQRNQNNRNEKIFPDASAGLTQEEHGYFYQQRTIYDDDMMYII